MGEVLFLGFIVAAMIAWWIVRDVYAWWHKRHYGGPDYATEERRSRYRRRGKVRFTLTRAELVRDSAGRVVVYPYKHLARKAAEQMGVHGSKRPDDSGYVVVPYHSYYDDP